MVTTVTMLPLPRGVPRRVTHYHSNSRASLEDMAISETKVSQPAKFDSESDPERDKSASAECFSMVR